MFFFDPSKGRIGHTGIVVRSTNDFIYTIEGNASDGVLERYYSRTDSYIDGYGENGGSAVEPPNPPISEGSSIQDVIGLIEQVESYCYSSQVKKDNEMVALETMNILRQEAYDGNGNLRCHMGEIIFHNNFLIKRRGFPKHWKVISEMDEKKSVMVRQGELTWLI